MAVQFASESVSRFRRNGCPVWVGIRTDGKGERKLAIAVSSWKTEYKSWVASVMRMTDPNMDRYARLNRLINSVISNPKGARYFILPELALPAHGSYALQ